MQSKRLSLISNSPFHINQAFLFGSEDPDEEDPSDDVENGNPDGGAGGDDSSDGRDPQKKIRALQEETNRHFELRRQAEEERDQLKQWKEEQDRKSRTEVENLQKDLADRDQRITALTEANKKLVVKNAFLQEQDYTWHNPERALSSVDLSGVEVNEDGTVKNPDALKSAIKKLADIVGIPKSLEELGVKREDFDVLAENALKDVCGLTNPVQASHAEIVGIFAAAFGPR